MLRARGQAENYARALPAEEGRPPFLIVVDVGNGIELYADFTRTGATYTPFPDPRSHRIRLADLRDDAIRARLRAVWLDPLSPRPGPRQRQSHARDRRQARRHRQGARKRRPRRRTRRRLSHPLPVLDVRRRRRPAAQASAFTDLLEASLQQHAPASSSRSSARCGTRWTNGGFSVVLRHTLPRFNGKLFKTPDVLPLDRDQIGLLREAASADWTQVEPAIFGTLLERALDPAERHSLGAHYTPRAYVERLVLPTVIEPLRERWANVQAAALLLANEGKARPPRSPRSTPSTTSSARCASSTRPAARPISSTSRSNT